MSRQAYAANYDCCGHHACYVQVDGTLVERGLVMLSAHLGGLRPARIERLSPSVALIAAVAPL